MPDWLLYTLGAILFLLACRAFIRVSAWLGEHGHGGDGGLGSI
ncbi:MAG: hypothetical protein ACIARR_05530 [Phycisphaerales bacterium JB059]